jgi:hypothetical protein
MLELADEKTLRRVAKARAKVRAHIWELIAATAAGFPWLTIAGKTQSLAMVLRPGNADSASQPVTSRERPPESSRLTTCDSPATRASRPPARDSAPSKPSSSPSRETPGAPKPDRPDQHQSAGHARARIAANLSSYARSKAD